MSTPQKPTSSAAQRARPTASLSSSAEASVANNGAEKLMADGARERHQAESDEQERLRERLRHRTHGMMAQAMRAKHGEPGMRQDEQRRR